MWVFAPAFLVSTALIAWATSNAVKTRFGRGILAVLAALVVSVFAGVRDLDSTVDMLLYGNNTFLAAAGASDFSGARDAMARYLIDGELGYAGLNYSVSRVTDDPNVFYAVLAFVSSLAIAVAVVLVRDYGMAWVMWFTYLCTAYVDAFNLLRQGPALALAVLGLALVLKTRYLLGLVVGMAGLLFHISAIFFFPIWVVAVILRRRRQSLKAVILILLATVVVSAGASVLLEQLGGLLSETKYIYYLESDTRAGLAIGAETLYRLVPIVAACILLAKNAVNVPVDDPLERVAMSQRSAEVSPTRDAFGRQTSRSFDGPAPASHVVPATRAALITLTSLLVIELVLLPIREITYALYRVPLYFGMARVLAYGVIVAQFNRNRAIAAIAAVGFDIAYFALVVIGRGEFEYRSVILDSWLAP